MRKALKVLKETMDSRIYNMAINEIYLGCPICAPNRGCNRNKKNHDNSWKTFRRTQWREKE